MDEKLDFRFLLHSTRARVYLLWAILATTGFVATHFYQRKEINAVWFAISVAGLGYMVAVMPLKNRQMRNIFLSWLVPIFFGMIISALAFRVRGLAELTAYLGAFWLIVMAVGYAWNGLADQPSGWYYFAAVLNFVAGILCYTVDAFTAQQYLVAAIVTAWSMLNLWLFRT